MRTTLLALLLAASSLLFAGEPLRGVPDDYQTHPCAPTAGLCATFQQSELIQFGARMQGSYLNSAWVEKHWDELSAAYAPYCQKLATCYAYAPNTYLFCDDVILRGSEPICDRFAAGSEDRQQCLFFIRTYGTGIQINSIDVWKQAQECAAKSPEAKTARKMIWSTEPAQLPAGFNGKFTVYAYDAETRVPIYARITIGSEILYVKKTSSGFPSTFYATDWRARLVRVPDARGHRDLAPPLVKLEAQGYETVTFPMPIEIPKMVVEMTPAVLKRGKNDVTFVARDAATGKVVDAQIMLGDATLGNIDLRGGALRATIEVDASSKHPKIWATSPFDAYPDVVILPARD